MTKEFKYKPPILNLILGLIAIAVSLLIMRSIGYGGLSLLAGFFALPCFTLGVVYIIMFITALGSGNLKIHDGAIEIPRRWRKPATIYFNDINKLNEPDDYSNVISISGKNGHHSIKRTWMNRKDFEELKDALRESMKSSTPPGI